MDFRIKFTEQAAEDITDIVKYISDELHSPSAARRFYTELNKKLDKISGNPFMYPLSRIDKLRAKGYRAAAIGNYLLFYITDEAVTVAYIARIVYGGRDINALFEE